MKTFQIASILLALAAANALVQEPVETQIDSNGMMSSGNSESIQILEEIEHQERKLSSSKSSNSASSKSSKAPTLKSTKATTSKSSRAPTLKSSRAPTLKSTKTSTLNSSKAPTLKSSKAPSVNSSKSRRELLMHVDQESEIEMDIEEDSNGHDARRLKSSKETPTSKSSRAPTLKSSKAPILKSSRAPTLKSSKAPSIKSRRDLLVLDSEEQ